MVFPQREDMPIVRSTNDVLPYIISVVILFLIGVIFIGGVLYLRPNADPLVVISTVFVSLSATGASIASFIKSQETKREVNSQLTAWKKEFYAMSHAEGVIAGTRIEQDRIVEQKRAAALSTSPSPSASLVPAPIPVAIISPDPLPVQVKEKS